MKEKIIFVVICILVLFCVSSVVWFIGSSNPKTPAGYVSYLTKGAVFGETKYIGTQLGPTSSGREWLLSVYNVSITPYTYTHSFTGNTAVISNDNMKLSFQVHVVWKIKQEKCQQFVEQFSTLGKNADPEEIVSTAYKNYLMEPIRTFSRNEIQTRNAFDVKNNIIEIGGIIQNKANELVNDTPYEIISVVVGNVQYPSVVADAVAKKLEAKQDLERKETEILIAEKEAEKRVAEARGIAEAMNIINTKLTDKYLQHEAIEAQKTMAGSPNHTTVYIPVGNNGLPLTGIIPN